MNCTYNSASVVCIIIYTMSICILFLFYMKQVAMELLVFEFNAPRAKLIQSVNINRTCSCLQEYT